MRQSLLLSLALLILALAPAGAEAATRVAGDFNGDGVDDLAIGAPNEDLGAVSNAGSVHVIYGSNGAGLTDAGNQVWNQAGAALLEAPEDGDQFGASLVAGDFNFDGPRDLAVGVPGESVGSAVGAGAVNVIYGSPGGLTATGDQLWHQDVGGILDASESVDSFGFSLSAGDFDGDSRADLSVGVPNENLGPPTNEVADAGAVNVIYGSSGDGLTATDTQLWHQDSSGIFEAAENFERFGSSLAAGDFDGAGRDDLAVGVVAESVGAVPGAGAVNVLYGSDPNGLTATGDQIWHQDVGGIADTAENSDRFGTSLSAGDFDDDLAEDLAVGVPQENVGSVADAGAVNLIYGDVGVGLTPTGDQIWNQDSAGIFEVPETLDNFGHALTSGDFDGDFSDDLAVGVTRESVGSTNGAGAVNVLYGTGTVGLTATDDQIWHQDIAGILDAAESGDAFGRSLTAGDFDSNLVSGRDDLAVGALNENVGLVVDAGAINAIYGSDPGGLTATGDQLWHQDVGTILDAAEDTDNFGGSLLGSPF